MFEKILIRRSTNLIGSVLIDVGLILESMLFYQKTIVVVDREAALRRLLESIGINNIIKLIEVGALELVYCETASVVHTRVASNGFAIHGVGAVSVDRLKFPAVLTRVCIGVAGKTGKGRRLANRLQGLIECVVHDKAVISGAFNSMLDTAFVERAAPVLLTEAVPALWHIENFVFRPYKIDDGIGVYTNIDFDAVNSLLRNRIPYVDDKLSPARLLVCLMEVEENLYYASRNLSEISGSSVDLSLLRLRVSHLVDRCGNSGSKKDAFQNCIFTGAKTIRQAYDRGSLVVEEVVAAIVRASEFKKWLAGQRLESSLIEEYYKEISRGSALDKLPNKTLRFGVFTGLGSVVDQMLPGGFATAAGLGLGVLDSFLLDSLLKGWRPNQFVDEVMVPLVNK